MRMENGGEGGGGLSLGIRGTGSEGGECEAEKKDNGENDDNGKNEENRKNEENGEWRE